MDYSLTICKEKVPIRRTLLNGENGLINHYYTQYSDYTDTVIVIPLVVAVGKFAAGKRDIPRGFGITLNLPVSKSVIQLRDKDRNRKFNLLF